MCSKPSTRSGWRFSALRALLVAAAAGLLLAFLGGQYGGPPRASATELVREASATHTATATPTATATDSPTATDTPSPTATDTPSATATPTNTATHTATITPTANQVGTYDYMCTQSSCGAGHSTMTAKIIITN